MSSDKKRRKSTGDWPTIHENQWYSFAITSAIFTAIAICGAFFWVFGDGFDGEADLKKAQALAPFGVALFALVTFCTASWRGSINTRQADQAEREGRAKLLQEGAKLLGQLDNPAHISAGIATLEILAVGDDERLAIQAMNLIADFVQAQMADSHDNQFREEAFSALANAAALGRVAKRSIRFKTDNGLTDWESLAGMRSVSYTGGSIDGGFFGDFEDRKEYRYKGVKLTGMELSIDSRFQDCEFSYCDIKSYGSKYGPSPSENLKFKNCDFSGCDFIGTKKGLPDFRQGDNHLYKKMPTIDGNEATTVDWADHFQMR
ncbi:hypothetical protein ACSV5S_20805 [Agrobacterium deltaense]|uniref:hypothetical protein n=1 Tax=Agrobacterium deltaense TaxID=1183412 RepID=UPI003FD5221F